MNSALLGLTAAISWGIHDFIGRFASRAMGQLITTFGLILSGLIALSLFTFVNDIPVPETGREFWLSGLAGAAYAFATLSLFAAYRIGSMSLVSPIAGSYPAVAVVYGLIGGAAPGAVAWAAIAAVIGGSLLVSAAGKTHEEGGFVMPGKLPQVLILSVACAGFFAVSLLAGQVAAPVIGETASVWLARGFALIAVVPLFAIKSMRGTAPIKWWPALIVMGLLDTAAMLAVFAAGTMTFPELAIVIGGSFGALVTMLAWLILREPVTPLQWTGVVMITAGVAVLSAGY